MTDPVEDASVEQMDAARAAEKSLRDHDIAEDIERTRRLADELSKGTPEK